MNKIDVLDKGYVRLVDTMGSDLSVVNAARVSYDKESTEFSSNDKGLLKFLIRENHTSPFRHAIMTLEVYAPLFVARQWWKHVIGGQHNEGADPFLAWNESSRRYVTENEEFYVPKDHQWRSKPANNKQGSAEPLPARSEGTDFKNGGEWWTKAMKDTAEDGLRLYREAMERGIAPEQARLFLPANSLYVRWRWTSSLAGVMHFIKLRDEAHSQWEIQEYARAVRAVGSQAFPMSLSGELNEV